MRRAAIALLLGLLGGCADGGESIAGIPAGAADGLYPQLIVAGPTRATTEVRVSLLRKPAGVMLGSFQGEFRFDPAALQFERAEFAPRSDGVAHLIAAGRVRFVGTALDGVAEVPLVVLQFTRTGEVKTSSLEVAFEEVTSFQDFSDLTGLVYGGPPLIRLVGN